MSNNIINTYNRLPVSFEKGKGCWLWDTEGNKYLDALSGIAVCGLGHSNPTVNDEIHKQIDNVIHTSNLYRIPKQEELAEKLSAVSGMAEVFFANSGTEANEAAIKVARLFGQKKGISSPVILSTEKSFHGRSMGALSATGNKKIQEGLNPLLPGFKHIPYNDIEAVKNAFENDKNICAFFIEPIQGEGGINTPDTDYLNKIRDLCDQFDVLMVIDEIQTGIARTGKMFAYQHNGITPDVLTLAKGLGNGVPIGACLVNGKGVDILQPGTHGSTFGGNPLACAAGCAVIDYIKANNIEEHVLNISNIIIEKLKKQFSSTPEVKSIKGAGLMIGIEINKPCVEIVKIALKNGLLLNVTSEKVVRILPPLIINEEEAEILVSILSKSIQEFLNI